MKLSIIFAIIGILILAMLIYAHEQGHQSIYRSYGIDSKIRLRPLAAVTIAEEPCPIPECTLAHDINDSIMYHIEMLISLLIFGFFFLLYEKELK